MKKALLLFCVLFLLVSTSVWAEDEPSGDPLQAISVMADFMNGMLDAMLGTGAEEEPTEEPEPEIVPTKQSPFAWPTAAIEVEPTEEPEDVPVIRSPFAWPTAALPSEPTDIPTEVPTNTPTAVPTNTLIPTATFTPTATATLIPTDTPTPVPTADPLEGIETQRGMTYKWYNCGDDFNFMMVYQPQMTKSQSGFTADNMFILFRVQIENRTGRVIDGLKYESFTLSREVNGVLYEYPLSGLFSTVTSMNWDLGLFRSPIQPGGTLDTYLVFDVEGSAADPWVLTFLPTERITNETFTPVRITLPAVAH